MIFHIYSSLIEELATIWPPDGSFSREILPQNCINILYFFVPPCFKIFLLTLHWHLDDIWTHCVTNYRQLVTSFIFNAPIVSLKTNGFLSFCTANRWREFLFIQSAPWQDDLVPRNYKVVRHRYWKYIPICRHKGAFVYFEWDKDVSDRVRKSFW